MIETPLPVLHIQLKHRVGIVEQSVIDQRQSEIDWIAENLKPQTSNLKQSKTLNSQLITELNIMRHYAPYIEQERKAAERAKLDEAIRIPQWLDYDKCQAVRFESRQQLKRDRPENLAQAARIPGVNPADVAVLAIIIKRGHI